MCDQRRDLQHHHNGVSCGSAVCCRDSSSYSRGGPCPCPRLGDLLLQTCKLRASALPGAREFCLSEHRTRTHRAWHEPSQQPRGMQPKGHLEPCGQLKGRSLDDSSQPRWAKKHGQYSEEAKTALLLSQLVRQRKRLFLKG